ncbi:MAG: Ku protein [Mycobacteriales bacterium]
MRAIWKGAVSFGLVSIPVRLYSATEERDVAFHQVHREDAGRIRYKRVCSIDGEEVPYADIAKGYELPSGDTVVITDDDLADLPLSTSREVDVLAFVPLEQVDPIYFAKSYYLEPDNNAAKPYVLLRDALEQSGRVALVKVALRQREALATLRTRDGVLVLETMVWPDEVRAPEFGFLDEDVTVRPAELSMAESLIESMTGDFAPEDYKDDYREALQAVIDAKVEGREVVAAEEAEETGAGDVVDLMAALRRSVNDAKRRRGEAVDDQDNTDEDDAAGAPAAKRSSPGARKAPAKKTAKKAAKKPPAKKAAQDKNPAAKQAAAKRATPRKRSAAKAERKSA